MRIGLNDGKKNNASRSNQVSHAIFFLTLVLCSFWGCVRPGVSNVPNDFKSVGRQPDIFPDYRDVTIPVNIAPLNYDLVEKDVEKALTVVSIVDGDGKAIREKATYFSGKKTRFSI